MVQRFFALNCATDVFKSHSRQRTIRRSLVAVGEIVQYRVVFMVQFRFAQVFEFSRFADRDSAAFMPQTGQRVRMTALGETKWGSPLGLAVAKEEPMPGCK